MDWFASARTVQRVLNLWPPFLFTGIRIERLSPDYRYCRVALRLRPWNKNGNGTHFGGSLFAMTDPVYSMMLMGIFGKAYRIWDKEADIDYLRPGRGRVYAEFRLTDGQLDAIRRSTSQGDKALPEFVVEVKDESGEVISRLRRVLYVRKKPPKQARKRHEPALPQGRDG
ncbi:DUF4442 domain-containing protein [Ferrimonas pelagia]|uniref:DUF4442 domain-containing protein n=1 Tax=Ferrimonas pelagia TaxID=1177826 RepID=UPI0031F11BF5